MLVGVALCWLSLPLLCNAALLALVGVAYGYQFARVRGWVLMLCLVQAALQSAAYSTAWCCVMRRTSQGNACRVALFSCGTF
jgi:hypothetical protein